MSDNPTVFPCLRYRDAQAAIAWLERAFGFAPNLVVPGDGDSIAHAQVRYGNGMVMLGSGGAPDPDNPWAAVAYGVYVRVDDVDAHCDRARAAGAEIVSPPTDKDYGARDYSVRDPEGRLWSFGDYDPFAAG
jgi:uncharacterized glyoxalase superfamily protein PhnB